jgi:hypothetical protein
VIEEKYITATAQDLLAELKRAYGIRSRSLSKALKKAGRRLPADLQAKAALIVQAQSFGSHPKLLRQIEGAEITKARDDILDYLGAIDPKEQRQTALINLAGDLAWKVLLIAVLIGAVLHWRGYV